MSDPTPPPASDPVSAIEVNASPAPAQWTAAVRQAILVAAGVAAALGATRAAGEISSLLAIAGPIAGLIVFTLGQIHIRRTAQQQIVMANALPDAVARIKGQ